MSARVRVGISSFAHMHAASYAAALASLDGVEVAGIADPDRGRGRRMSRRLGVPYVGGLRALLREGLDGLVVTSENSRHTAEVQQAARAGVNVLCEKPIATNAADARRQIAACRRAGVIHQTAFPMRFSAPVIRTRAAVLGGAIGTVLGANTTNHGRMPGGWFTRTRLSGGGAVIDHTVHVADLLRWILRDEVVEVYAETGRLIAPRLPCEDCGLISMRFSRGTIATLDASWSRVDGFPTWGDVTLFLFGDRGVLSVDAFAQHVVVHSRDGTRHLDWGDSPDLGLVGEFVGAIRERRPPSVTGEDGLRALEIALAAYRSARTRRPAAVAVA